jgi:hypothetical protein
MENNEEEQVVVNTQDERPVIQVAG